MMEQIGGRKAAACLIGLAVVVGCYLAKGAIPDQLIDAVKYLVSTYLVGNIAADVVDGVANQAKIKVDASTQSSVTAIDTTVTDRLSKDMTTLDSKVNQLSQAIQLQDQTLRQVVEVISKPIA